MQTTEQKKIGNYRNTILIMAMFAGFVAMMPLTLVPTVSAFITGSLQLSTEQVGQLLSAAYIGQIPMLIIAGPLADRVGGKKVMTLSLAGMAVVAIAMFFLASSFQMVYIFVIAFGFFVAAMTPAGVRLIMDWFPAMELQGAIGRFYSVMMLPAALLTFVFVMMATQMGWPITFLFVAVLAIPLLLWVLVAAAGRPENKKGMSAEEVTYITDGRFEMEKPGFGDTLKALVNPNVLIMILAYGAVSVATAMSSWPYQALMGFGKVDPTMVALGGTAIMILVALYGLFLHGRVAAFFKGSVQKIWTAGIVVAGIGMLIGAFGSDLPWYVWMFGAMAMLLPSSIVMGSVLPTYYQEIVGMQYVGTLTSWQLLLQTVVASVVLSLSGSWVNPTAPGLHAVTPLYLIAFGAIVVGLILPWLVKRVSAPAAAGQEG